MKRKEKKSRFEPGQLGTEARMLTTVLCHSLLKLNLISKFFTEWIASAFVDDEFGSKALKSSVGRRRIVAKSFFRSLE